MVGIAKIFKTGRSQAVRLPKEYRFSEDQVYIRKKGEDVILSRFPESWIGFFENDACVTEDWDYSLLSKSDRQEHDGSEDITKSKGKKKKPSIAGMLEAAGQDRLFK